MDNLRGGSGRSGTLLYVDLDGIDGTDGFAVRRPLGAGSVGSAWLARDLASGRPVVLKRVPATEVPVPELFRRDLALAQGLKHPHVARLLDLRQTDEDWLLISEYVAAGSLADLLQRRGPLSRGELVTLVAPLAQGLAAAHAAGLTHGHLGGGDVMFTADGRPMLTDFGLRLTAGRESSPAADDLIALRDLALRAGGEPKVFSLKLFAGDSATLADRVLALAEPEPVNLGFDHVDGAAGPPARTGTGRSARRGRRRAARKRAAGPTGVGKLAESPSFPTPVAGASARVWPELLARVRLAHGLLVAGGLAAILVLAAGVAMLRSAHEPGPTAQGSATPSGEPTPGAATPGGPTPGGSTPRAPTSGPAGEMERARAAAGWSRTLRGLDVRRSRAFAAGDPGGLDRVYVPGSAPWASDRALLASYRARGLKVVGLEIRVDRLVVDRAAPARVVLRVVDRLVAGAAVDQAGRRTALPPGRPSERLITLNGSGGGWRIVAVSAT